ncbi:MAG: SDR family oxidoreductase [Psychroflexus sp.]|uniref:SDR family oxidoreductase n=1 Tax=Psychroflexus sp. S27 TaxID=1982757 RepID=UPI000C2A423E|nr:SDR family oxidoreductase [Psychroflexus sp. S27]PJX26945.1 hypothetical protein CAP47_01990 [Psychroflexus sp. S27]
MKNFENQVALVTGGTAAKEAIRGLGRVANWKENHPEQYEQVANNTPLKHFGEPEKDVAPVVIFLLSKDCQYMTGQILMDEEDV